MNSPFDNTAILELLKAAQLIQPSFNSNLKHRSPLDQLLGKAPDIVGRLWAYKEVIRKVNLTPGLSARQQNLNLCKMTLLTHMIILELEHAFPIPEGRHCLCYGGDVVWKDHPEAVLQESAPDAA